MLYSKNKQLASDINHILDVIKSSLGDILLGGYIFGSSVTGGLKPNSDLDILILVQKSIPSHTRQILLNQLLNISGKLIIGGSPRPIEMTVIVLDDIEPWYHPPRSDFVFGEWLRRDFEAGFIPMPTIDPDLTIVLSSALRNSKTMIGIPLNQYISDIPATDIQQAIVDSLPQLVAEPEGDERNVILALARMWYTLTMGEIVPKDIAAQWLEEQLPEPYRPILRLAREAYLGKKQDIWSDYKREVESFVSYANQYIKKLAG